MAIPARDINSFAEVRRGICHPHRTSDLTGNCVCYYDERLDCAGTFPSVEVGNSVDYLFGALRLLAVGMHAVCLIDLLLLTNFDSLTKIIEQMILVGLDRIVRFDSFAYQACHYSRFSSRKLESKLIANLL